jgi:DNA-binding NarL/FixJ family response regulator
MAAISSRVTMTTAFQDRKASGQIPRSSLTRRKYASEGMNMRSARPDRLPAPRPREAVVIAFPARRPRAIELSTRELRALELTAGGYEISEIAKQMSADESMFLAPETVRSYQQCARSKLGARSLAHAVAIAAQRQLIRLDP